MSQDDARCSVSPLDLTKLCRVQSWRSGEGVWEDLPVGTQRQIAHDVREWVNVVQQSGLTLMAAPTDAKRSVVSIVVTYERTGGTEDYRDAVEGPMDLLENTLVADGWSLVDAIWSIGGRAFTRTGAQMGTERVSIAIML